MPLVGFIKKKFVTMHGHMNVKKHSKWSRLQNCNSALGSSLLKTTLQQSIVGIQLYSQQKQCHTFWTRLENLLIPCEIPGYHINDCENCVFWHVTSQKFTNVFGWAFRLQQTFQRNPMKVAGFSERLVNFYQTTQHQVLGDSYLDSSLQITTIQTNKNINLKAHNL